MTTSTNPATAGDQSFVRGEIVARAGTYFRNTRYLITIALLAMGLWFGYDGFINWPRQYDKYEQLEKERLAAEKAGDAERAKKLLDERNTYRDPKNRDWDLGLQRLLFYVLPPLGIAAFVRWMYISRGAYRLGPDNVLHVPGHPPVPLDAISELDKRLWDRKGIAYVGYELPDGRTGRLKLDDFVYQREPTDQIFDRINEYVTPQAQAETSDTPEAQEQEQSAG
jgi:hypothetical protein